jgi:MinD-like ATPase involved in chromosome partitioning or flagellar assembly
MLGARIGVLVAAAGASWEVEALRTVSDGPSGAVLLKRCVDLPDLLATAATGQARAAVVSARLPGLDAESLDLLRAAGIGVVVVAEAAGPTEVADLPGVVDRLDEDDLSALGVAIRSASDSAGADDPESRVRAGARRAQPPATSAGVAVHRLDSAGVDPLAPQEGAEEPGHVLAVWGPTGAPGRTTVAVSTAAELARAGHDVLLVDADPYGGAVAQHLGVLDEVSGLLSAVRLANAGQLDAARLASVARAVGPRLRILTGLPRADRWAEVRGVAFDGVLDAARNLCSYVVLDLGFALEQADQAFGSSAPQRNLMTVAGLDHADEILVVGSADPVGLARLARGLVELPEVVPAATTRVVVNRVRPSLGWGENEVRAMVEGFVTPASTHFLPHDLAAADRALMAGQPVSELAESALGKALTRLAVTVAGEGAAARPREGRRSVLRRRTAGRGR